MKIKKLLLPLISCITLSGCSIVNDLLDNIFSPGGGASGGQNSTSNSVTFKDYLDVVELEALDSIGEQNILVIPVDFTGDKLLMKKPGGYNSSRDYAKVSSRSVDHIRKAFFGESSETGWESVSSYYYKSSYGKLKITGEVTDTYYIDCSVYDLISGNKGGDRNDPTYYVLENAVEWVRNNTNIDLKNYDKNSDGLIDSVFLIYNVDYSDTNLISVDKNNLFWAYSYWDIDTTASLSNPVPCVYGWASRSFMDDGGYTLPDAHTYIHEVGHLLGLDDYYSYDEDDYGAIGGLDMMDANIGDQNAYSKSLLGWTNPTHIKEAGTYTLKPFESSGDCFIIKPNWGGSFLDEYLIIEYYTPTGLNYLDSKTAYTNRDLLFSKRGIKVLHVDARLAKLAWNTNTDVTHFKGFTDSLLNSYNSTTGIYSYSDIAASNTASRSYSEYKLITIIDAGVPLESLNRVKSGSFADNSFLYYYGQGFGYNGNHTTFKFNSGIKPDFGFKIDSLTATGATITFFENNN